MRYKTVASTHTEALSGLDLIQLAFPGTLQLLVEDVANLVRLKTGTIRNMISEKTFPIPSTKENGSHRVFDVRDVAAYLDAKRVKAHQESSILIANSKPKLGASTKAERIKAKSLGVTVVELRSSYTVNGGAI